VSRLTGWSPHWVNIPAAADGVKIYIGVSFLCPHCTHSPCPTCGAQRGKRLAFSFWPPIIPSENNAVSQELAMQCVEQVPHANFHQRLSGDSFETLTIKPSIGFESAGHWHGTITQGECQP
jgi:hypothetical protein